MIVPLLVARMKCDEKGCAEDEPVQLALTAAGGFAFRPQRDCSGWQVGALGMGGMGVYTTFCPAHARKVAPVTSPVIQTVGH